VNPQEVTLTLPLETVNAALVALSKLPYEAAKPHIDIIQQRGAEALAAANAQQAPEAAAE
jgi:hypothetical protein